jgi:hypothetical protein
MLSDVLADAVLPILLLLLERDKRIRSESIVCYTIAYVHMYYTPPMFLRVREARARSPKACY